MYISDNKRTKAEDLYVDTSKANCWSPADKEMLTERINASGAIAIALGHRFSCRSFAGGFEPLNEFIFHFRSSAVLAAMVAVGRDANQGTFDMVQSGALLRALSHLHHMAEAAGDDQTCLRSVQSAKPHLKFFKTQKEQFSDLPPTDPDTGLVANMLPWKDEYNMDEDGTGWAPDPTDDDAIRSFLRDPRSFRALPGLQYFIQMNTYRPFRLSSRKSEWLARVMAAINPTNERLISLDRLVN